MSFILLGILNSQTTATAAGAYDLLETTLISSNTASVTFSSLGSYSDYKHLQIRATYRTSDASPLDAIDLWFNGVNTGTSYARHTLSGGGSSVSSFSSSSNAKIFSASVVVGATATSNVFSAGIFDILDFGSSNKNTTIKIFNGHAEGTTNQIRLNSGLYASTNAITSVTLAPNSGTNFVANCRFSLYGVK